MPSIPDQSISILMAERRLGKVSGPEFGIKALELGYDTKSLRMLAASLVDEPPSVLDDLYRRAIDELGWAKMHPTNYLIEYAKFVAEGILSDRIDPVSGSKDLYRILLETDHHSSLSAWYDIDDMISAQEYFKKSGKKEYFYKSSEELDAVIKQACRDFLGRTSQSTGYLPETEFEDAESYLQEFLNMNRHSKNLLWVFAEDVMFSSTGALVRKTDFREARETAKAVFEVGKSRGLGIELHAFGVSDGVVCAYIVLPEDKTDAQYRLIDANFIKYSIREEMLEAKFINSLLLWRIRKLFDKDRTKTEFDTKIASRKLAA